MSTTLSTTSCLFVLQITNNNKSSVTGFFLLGFSEIEGFHIPFALVLMMIYVTAITGNVLIVVLVSVMRQFHFPMYFFLGQLSVCDILISTNVIPKALQIVVEGGNLMCAMCCVTQLYFFGASAIIECCLLTVMSYDRYLAICDPLHYASIMNIRLTHYLITWSWATGFITALVTHCIFMEIKFCGSNLIDHYFCDLPPLLDLSCSDTSLLQSSISAIAVTSLFQLCFVIITYVCISLSIFRISSSSGRQKAYSTCSSHLTVVCMYYGTLTSINIIPSKGYSLKLKKYLSLLNTVFCPLFNPMIYALRNRDIKKAIVGLWSTRVNLSIQ